MCARWAFLGEKLAYLYEEPLFVKLDWNNHLIMKRRNFVKGIPLAAAIPAGLAATGCNPSDTTSSAGELNTLYASWCHSRLRYRWYRKPSAKRSSLTQAKKNKEPQNFQNPNPNSCVEAERILMKHWESTVKKKYHENHLSLRWSRFSVTNPSQLSIQKINWYYRFSQ